ncbi:MAG: peptidoglycan DD-metalloendopeptidase family protein [Bacteriovoracaceae bacterium]|nr:peptidoglycan DD-metalloendopeptidase family protein [Bacteriovoracaceae bacterium]
MDRYYTLMIIPEKEKGVKSIRIPGLFFKSFAFIFVVFTLLIGILAYDYWKILQQVYENKHLTLENRQLKEQVQLFQMKINTLAEDLRRIHTFEKKLRVITGLEELNYTGPTVPLKDEDESNDEGSGDDRQTSVKMPEYLKNYLNLNLDFSQMETEVEYQNLKNLYDQKIAANLGIQKNYNIAKDWSELSKRSFNLAKDYASFDFQFNKIKSVVSNMEEEILKLDEYLLDKDSLLRSTPTFLPTNGWITDYYGQRINPVSGRLRMHEGLDVGATPGTPIYAPADGLITFSGRKAGFGNFVQIDHGYGIETIYAHNQSLHIKLGDSVKRGRLIARVGNTGNSTGPHLHYEVRVNGVAVDPLYYVLE